MMEMYETEMQSFRAMSDVSKFYQRLANSVKCRFGVMGIQEHKSENRCYFRTFDNRVLIGQCALRISGSNIYLTP